MKRIGRSIPVLVAAMVVFLLGALAWFPALAATPTPVVSGFTNITAIAVNGDFVYVGTIGGQLYRFPKTSTRLQLSNPAVQNIANVSGYIDAITFDGGYIYFDGNPCAAECGSIYRMPLDLSLAATPVIYNVIKLLGVVGSQIYYWDGDESVKRISVSGGNPEPLLPPLFLGQFAFDASAMFYDYCNNNGVCRVDLATKIISTPIPGELNAGGAVLLDANNVYTGTSQYAPYSPASIYQATKQAGGQVITLLTSGTGEYGISPKLSDGQHVYYEDYTDNVTFKVNLKSIPVGGGTPTTLAEDVSLKYMVNDGGMLYWGTRAEGPGEGAVFRLVANPPGFLEFPLDVLCHHEPCTPYTANIASVMDHSGTPLDPINNPGRWYLTDGKVAAFTGEVGIATFGTNCSPGPGYKNAENIDFIVNGNYVGASCPGKKPSDHDPDANVHPRRFLNYDGHPGYDYPYDKDTPIVAPAAGKLFKATKDTVNHTHNPKSKCFDDDAWTEWHAFYIEHDNGYVSWFLHADRLAKDIEKTIKKDLSKFVVVTQGEVVGYVGNYTKCASVGYHLHYELRKGMDEVVDPYSQQLWTTSQ